MSESESGMFQAAFEYAALGMLFVAPDLKVVRANRALAVMLGQSHQDLAGLDVLLLADPQDRESIRNAFQSASATPGSTASIDARLLPRDNLTLWTRIDIVSLPSPVGFVLHLRDMTLHRQLEMEHTLTTEIFEILGRTDDADLATRLILSATRRALGIEAAAIRLARDGDFTYAAHEGFPEDFIAAENCLRKLDEKGEPATDEQGVPLFECTCGLVLMGRTDPRNAIFTASGCVCVNDAAAVRSRVGLDQRIGARNRCVQSGYRSVALIPIRSKKDIIGLLHLSDHRPHQFPPELFSFLEGIACSVGVALEQKRAQDRLARSYELLTQAHAVTRSGQWSWDVRRNSVEWSESYYTLVGLKPGEVEPSLDAWMSTVHPEDRQQVQEAVSNARFASGPLDLEWRVLFRDGTIRWLMSRCHIERDAENAPIRYTGITLDITDRKAMEERFQKLFQVAPVLMSLSTLEDGEYLEVNEAFVRTSGFSREELVGRSYAEVGWMSKQGRAQLLAQLDAHGRFRNLPLTTHARDGREVHCLYSGETVPWGEKQALLSIALDVTDSFNAQRELQRGAEALRESEARFRELFERSPVAMWEEDLSLVALRFAELRQEGVRDLHAYVGEHPEVMAELASRVRVLAVNQASLQLFGAATFDELARDLGGLFDDSAWAVFRRAMSWLYLGEGQFEAEIAHWDVKGRILDVYLRLSVLHGQSGGLSRVLLSFTDLTAHKVVERQRRELEREVDHLQRLESLGRLAGGVAHDINNVLGVIMAIGSLLEARQEPDIAKDAATLIRAATRGRDLVQALRDFSRKELQSVSETDLNEIARHEADLIERTCLKRITVNLDLEPNLPTVFGEVTSIQNALMNLCVNAMDAMPQKGTLTLRTRRIGEGFVGLIVEDDGEGMPPEVLARAMEPFFTTKPMGKGTGLGLSQVYGTMKAHGGSVDIESTVGKGTRIRLAFPVMQQRLTPRTAVSATPAPARSLAVLVIDDEDLLRGLVLELLESLGHSAQGASGGLEALSKIEAGLAVDLVVLDLNMPGLDGVETLARLRALRPELPVLLATGHADERLPTVLTRFPGVHTLMKPFGRSELAQAMSTLLSS